MNKLATFALAFSFSFACAADAALKELQPVMGKALDLSAEKAAEFEKIEKALEKAGWNFDKLPPSQQKFAREHMDGDYARYWDARDGGYDWYHMGSVEKVTASSYLKSSGNITYLPQNAHDNSNLNAWVEGVKGYGIGEYLTYYFKANNNPISQVIVVNGYVKSEKAYKDNSRAKKLKMYIDDKPVAILNLKDVRQRQIFEFESIEHPKRGQEGADKLPNWTIKFEIMEVYKGDKYDDTAISEIYFGGSYGLCFAAGAKILMADNSLKNIEQIKAGDMVKSYDFKNKKLVNSKVAKLISVAHSDLHKLKFGDKEIIATADHPFWTERNVWAAVNAEKANRDYRQETPVESLKAGDKIFIPEKNSFSELTRIENINGQQITYTIELSDGGNFIANGALAKTEEPK